VNAVAANDFLDSSGSFWDGRREVRVGPQRPLAVVFLDCLRMLSSHAADFVAHAGERTATLEEDMAAAREERKALPDLHIKILQMLAERDLAAVYWMASGTNTQEGLGFPATGRKISIPGMTIFRFQDGTMRLRSGRLRGSSLPLQR
jgi:predicted ester cyclase